MTADEALRIAELVSALDRRTWDAARAKSWAGVLQRAALAERLPAELLLLTCEELLREVEACDVSPSKLLKRAKEKPPAAWVQRHKRLAGPTDAYTALPYPEGEGFTRTSSGWRARYDASVAGWSEGATAQAMARHQRKLGARVSPPAKRMTQAAAVKLDDLPL